MKTGSDNRLVARCTTYLKWAIRGFPKVKREDESVSFGYACAYRDFLKDEVIEYPLGVHIIAGSTRRVYHWLLGVSRKKYSAIDRAFMAGVREGARRKRGYISYDGPNPN